MNEIFIFRWNINIIRININLFHIEIFLENKIKRENFTIDYDLYEQ